MGTNDGRHDFDFLFGAWQISNRKRVDMLVPGDDEWVEFGATSEARPIFVSALPAEIPRRSAMTRPSATAVASSSESISGGRRVPARSR